MRTLTFGNAIAAHIGPHLPERPLAVRRSGVPGARWEKLALGGDDAAPFYWVLVDLTGARFDWCLGQVVAYRRDRWSDTNRRINCIAWTGAIYVDGFGDYATPKQAMAELEQRWRRDGAEMEARQKRFYESEAQAWAITEML